MKFPGQRAFAALPWTKKGANWVFPESGFKGLQGGLALDHIPILSMKFERSTFKFHG
jgi:hypothetical protein